MDTPFRLSGHKAVLHSLAGIAGFVLLQIGAGSLIFRLIPAMAAAQLINGLVSIALLLAFLFVYCTRVLRITLADCRVKKPRHLCIWLVIAVALPVLVSAFFLLFVPGIFAYENPDTKAMAGIFSRAVFGVCLAAGISEELIFRGYVMRILEARWGKAPAILVPSVIFGLLHIANMKAPNLMDILVLLIAGTSAGVMFSLIAYQSDSIWPGSIVHGVWNFIIIGNILDIGVEHGGTSLWTYTLESDSTLVTGGTFGIESSLPAILGYLCVIGLAIFLQNRKPKVSAPG
jgi:membrane protease YdiL (CAAX protease family)